MHTDIWKHRNRRIWASAHEIGLAEEELRDVVEGITRKRSISGLSETAQGEVIQALDGLKRKAQSKRRRQKKRVGPEKGHDITARQIRELRRLSEALGWGRPALRAWLQRYHKTDREEWLTASRASRAIQGLRSMVECEKGETAAR